jgi:hypothetical protein
MTILNDQDELIGNTDRGVLDDSAALKSARKNPNKPMNEAALIAAIDDSDNRSYGSNLSNLTAQLSSERALAIDMYVGKNVDPAPEGQSNVIDRTVFETIQWQLPSLCRIFANGDDVVSIVPIDQRDVPAAEQESAYLNHVLTQKLPWFDLFLEWATDALLTKNAYFLVYEDEDNKVSVETYKQQTKQGVAYLIQDPTVQLVEAKQYVAKDLPPEPVMDPQTGQPIIDPQTGGPMLAPAMLYDVVIRKRGQGKRINVRCLPPERVKVDQRAFSWRIDDRCNYFEYWEETTLTELRDMGFDVPTDIADDPELYTQEDYARDQFGERRLERYKPTDPSMRRVKARMIWIRVDHDGDGSAELLKVLRVGRRILDIEEVERIPVASGVACPLPHRHYGLSVADQTIDIQRIKTTILREGLDNLYLSNNPQKVLNPAMVNLEEALISRAGGVIQAQDINQIRYEEHPFVFPQAVQGLEYMDQVRESRTGTNRYFTGIDQNSLNKTATGVQTLTSMAAQRVEQIARVLAFGIEDLASIVHELVLKQGHKREMMQIKGRWVEVDPGEWRKRTSFKIAVAFSAGNKDQQMAHLMAQAQLQSQAFQLGLPVVTPNNYFATLMEITKTAGLSSPERFWTDPTQIPPRPPQVPEGVQTAQIKTESDKSIAAAQLLQKDVESQREAQLKAHEIAIKANAEVLRSWQEHMHDRIMAGVDAKHDAFLTKLKSSLLPTPAAQNAKAKEDEVTGGASSE